MTEVTPTAPVTQAPKSDAASPARRPYMRPRLVCLEHSLDTHGKALTQIKEYGSAYAPS